MKFKYRPKDICDSDGNQSSPFEGETCGRHSGVMKRLLILTSVLVTFGYICGCSTLKYTPKITTAFTTV